MVRAILFPLIIAILAAGAVGQTAYTPEKGSAERKAILDVLRIPVERDLNRQKITFVTDSFKISGTWAFVSGVLQTPSGGYPDFKRTKFADAVEAGAFDNNVFGLLRKTAGKWKVTTYAIGCTDVCYIDWWSRYRAPKEIFPYTE